MATTKQLERTFQLLSQDEQAIIYALMLRLIPDDVATEEDIASHKVALDEFSAWRDHWPR